MIKIWKGPEMEGPNISIPTLFVCSDKEVSTNLIVQMLQTHKEISRIYFGAGKHSFQGITDWNKLCEYCIANSISIIMEVGITEIREKICKYDSPSTIFIIAQYNFPHINGKLQFKTDNNAVVTVFTPAAQTSLKTLKENNLFTCDTMLLEEE